MSRTCKPAPLTTLAPAMRLQLISLTTLLGDVVEELTEASALLDSGDLNAAMGTLGNLDEHLADASALYRGLIVLHRHR